MKRRDLNEIFNQLRDVSNSDGIVEGIIGEILGEIGRLNQRTGDKISPGAFTKIADECFNRNVDGRSINTYPEGKPSNCHPLCVCNAFGKWNSYKNGFKGTAKYLIEKYFKACGHTNRNVIILTFAWDEIDFNERFKTHFDNYVAQGKSISVILLTSQDITIPYRG